MKQVPQGIAKLVIQQDAEDQRFEAFCVDLLTRLEGNQIILPTSPSWDGGKDGRTAGPGPKILLCASLTDGVPTKVQKDLERLAATGESAETLYFCTSQDASNHTLDSVAQQTASILPAVQRAEGLGARELARFSYYHPEPLWRHYRAEIEEYVAALAANDVPEEDDQSAYLLALEVATNDSSGEIRDATYRSALLRVLSPGAALNLAETCRDLAALLRISRSMPSLPVRQCLEQLVNTDRVRLDGDRYVITEKGMESLGEGETEGLKLLLSGRDRIRERLESLCDIRFDDGQFARMWKAVQGAIALAFQNHGHHMVRAIAALTADESLVAGEPEVEDIFFADRIAGAAAAASGNAAVAEDVRAAFKDVFCERNGPAHEWLVRVAASFITICTLGIEARSGAKLREALAETNAVLDSDVAIELLAVGEPSHQAAVDLMKTWKELGGKIWVPEPVLEEVGHHAWIAQTDYDEVADKFLRDAEDRRRFVKNAFVRSFGYLASAKKARWAQWPAFIKQFLGDDEWDGQAIFDHLATDFGVRRLPDADLGAGIGARVWHELQDQGQRSNARGRAAEIEMDKLRRDARLFASMSLLGDSLRAMGGSRAVMLISSSRRLRAVTQRHGDQGELAMSLGDAVYLVSMAPGVSLGLTAMSALLFDGRLTTSDGALDTLIMRSVRAAGHTFPYARRARLCKQVRANMVDAARDRGEEKLRPERFDPATMDDSTRECVTDSIARALTAVGAESPTERRVAELEKEVKRLQAKLERRDKD